MKKKFIESLCVVGFFSRLTGSDHIFDLSTESKNDGQKYVYGQKRSGEKLYTSQGRKKLNTRGLISCFSSL